MTQIRRIEADAKKHRQEVLMMTNVIQDTIEKNNVIFADKWETTHECINCRSEDIHLLKNWSWISRPYLVSSKTPSNPARIL